VRSLLVLALVVPVAAAQDDDPLPVAPPPRLKSLPTARKSADPSAVATGKKKTEPTTAAKATPTPEPAPKVTPTPQPAPTSVAKVDPPLVPPTAAPKAEPPTPTKAEPKADETSAATATLVVSKKEPSFMDWTLPLSAVYAYVALALLVVLRTYTVKPKP
jgi:hypothetical protein